MYLYANPLETSRDHIELLDNRCFDRYSAPVTGEDGEYFGRIWLFRDMTEQRRASEALDRANRQVTEALRNVEQQDAMLLADLEQARAFQQSILPALPSIPGVELDAVYRPLDQVGGDLYHVSLQGSSLRLIVADATGHGVTAAMSTMLLRSEYEAARVAGRRPADVLRALHDRMVSTYRSVGVRFTAVCADLDLETGELRWSSAAHPAPIHLHDGKAIELETGGPFVGVGQPSSFPEWIAKLSAGDGLCVYSDGIVESANAEGERFGDARLSETLAAAHEKREPLATAAARAFDAFLGKTQASDDVTVLAVKWRGPARAL
jgi:sigma-B regulation protein RsbU (phosphoserine phosphatase)